MLAALSDNDVIGRAGRLPWHLPDELRHVKTLTTGHTLVMGRKTYESIGKPLPGRTSIVLTRNADFECDPEVIVATDFDAALDAAAQRGESEVFVFGGETVYALALPRADRLYLTRVHATVEGDAHFPEFAGGQWKLLSETEHPADDRHAHSFTLQVLERNR